MDKRILKNIENENLQGIKELLDNSDLNAVDDYGDSALHIAVLKRNKEIVKLLLDKGLDANPQNNDLKTPLHYTAESNQVDIAKMILSAGGDLSIVDRYGNSPLWTAVFNVKGNPEKLSIVELFLANQADKNHKNNAGRSPLDFANQVKYQPTLKVLEKY